MGELGAALELAQALEDPQMIARPLAAQGAVMTLATGADPTPALHQAIELARAAGDDWTVSYALWWEAAYWAWARSSPAAAHAAMAEMERMGRRAASASCLGWSDWIGGIIAWQEGRLEDALAELERGLHRSFECREPLLELALVTWGLLDTLVDLGRYDQAETLGRATIGRSHRTLDVCRQGLLEASTIRILVARGELTAARAELEPIEAAARASGLPAFVQWWLWANGRVALEAGDLAVARAAFDEAIELATMQNWPTLVSVAQSHHGLLAVVTGDLAAAENHLQAALATQVAHGFRVRAAETLESLAQVATAGESHLEATRLLGAADALRTATGGVRAPIDRPRHDRCVASTRATLGDEAFAQAWAEGTGLTLNQVAAYASRARGERKRPSSGWDSLTPTELQVVVLAATGLTNAQIGEKLFVAPGTVKTHLQNVYAKLGVANRAALAAEAVARGLTSGG